MARKSINQINRISIKSYWVFTLAMMLSVFACSYEEGTEKHTVNNEFSIEVPHYLSESDKLHPEAVFQYESRFRTVYILVLKDEKAKHESLDAYADFAAEDLSSRLVEPEVQKQQIESLNNAPAREFQIEGLITGQAVAYYLATVEGPQSYYRVLGWTLETKSSDEPGRKEKYFPDITKMVHSFTLLNP